MKSNKYLLFIITILSVFLSGEILAKKAAKMKDTDRETVAFLIAINGDEIAISKAVLNRVKNVKVKDFAEMMIKDHTQNLNETERLGAKENIVPKKTAALIEQEKKDNKEKNKLKELKGVALEKQYMKTMVNGHQKVLNAIDEMIPKTKNKALRDHLVSTRKAVAHHLKKAKEVKSSLKLK